MKRAVVISVLLLLTGCLSQEAAKRERDEQARLADEAAQNDVYNRPDTDMNAYDDGPQAITSNDSDPRNRIPGLGMDVPPQSRDVQNVRMSTETHP